jgi:hypothetical protein
VGIYGVKFSKLVLFEWLCKGALICESYNERNGIIDGLCNDMP